MTSLSRQELIEKLKKDFKNEKVHFTQINNELSLLIQKEDLLYISKLLKGEPYKFEQLIDLTAVDYTLDSDNIELIYQLLSISNGQRLRLKIILNSKELEVESLHNIWQAANWHERECYEMFGINFKHHPNLKRLLTPADFSDHPLRKKFQD